MAFDPTVGTEGRVALGVGLTPVAGIMEWRLNKRLTPIPINHFELTADAIGVVWQVFERGLASATATIRGHYNSDSTDATESGTPALILGAAVILYLVFEKVAPFGYGPLAGFVSEFTAGTNVENQTGTFDATIQLTGAVGTAG